MRGLFYNKTATQVVVGVIGRHTLNLHLSEGRRNERRRIETRQSNFGFFETKTKRFTELTL